MKTPLALCGGVLLLMTACGGGDQKAPVKEPAPQPAPTTQKETPKEEEPKDEAPKNPFLVRLNMEDVTKFFGAEAKAPPSDNKATPDMVGLGRMLYHDKALSKKGNQSCASCHDLDNFGVDGKVVSAGSDGTKGERNTPTTLNTFRQFSQFWDGRASASEDSALQSVLNPAQHGLADEADLVKKLQAQPEIVKAFEVAFGGADTVTAENFKKALGAFERTLTTRSKWDEFLDGDTRALSYDERLGLKTFIEIGCTECHTSRLVGGDQYQVLGKFKPYPGSEDLGRFKITKVDTDKHVFKVPSLLNIEKTAPYLHDGKVKTLEEAVKLMADIQLNKKITAEQQSAIVAFLKALTGKPNSDWAIK